MSTFTESIRIDAPIELVWDVLADIGTIAEWNPGLKGSHSTNHLQGSGATRFCDIDGRHNLEEEVVHFEPAQAITFRITRSTLPFQAADISFRLLSRSSQTEVSVSPTYVLKYGVVGRLLDLMFVSKTYRKGMRGLLSGLKERAEYYQSQNTPNMD